MNANAARSVEETIRKYLHEQFAAATGNSLPGDTESLREAGIVDSMGVLAIILFVEETFAITVSDDDVRPANFDSIANMAAYVRRMQAI